MPVINKQQLIIIIVIIVVSTTMADAAQAESSLRGNIGVTTNYVWRGITQTDDKAAVSSGIDFTGSSGWYIGGWTTSLNGSNSDGHYELDFYTGYRFNIGPTKMDVGYKDYRFPVGPVPADFDEAFIKASFKNYSAGVGYTIRKGDHWIYKHDLYTYLSAAFEIKKDLYLDFLIGSYKFADATQNDYSHAAITLRKNNFTFSFHKAGLSGSAGDTRWSGSWTKYFDL